MKTDEVEVEEEANDPGTQDGPQAPGEEETEESDLGSVAARVMRARERRERGGHKEKR